MGALRAWSLPFNFSSIRWNLFLKIHENYQYSLSQKIKRHITLTALLVVSGFLCMFIEKCFLPQGYWWSGFSLGLTLCYGLALIYVNKKSPTLSTENNDFHRGDFVAICILLGFFVAGLINLI